MLQYVGKFANRGYAGEHGDGYCGVVLMREHPGCDYSSLMSLLCYAAGLDGCSELSLHVSDDGKVPEGFSLNPTKDILVFDELRLDSDPRIPTEYVSIIPSSERAFMRGHSYLRWTGPVKEGDEAYWRAMDGIHVYNKKLNNAMELLSQSVPGRSTGLFAGTEGGGDAYPYLFAQDVLVRISRRYPLPRVARYDNQMPRRVEKRRH